MTSGAVGAPTRNTPAAAEFRVLEGKENVVGRTSRPTMSPETPPAVRIPGQEVGGVSTIPTFAIQYGRLSVFNALSATDKRPTDATTCAHVLVLSQCQRASSSMQLWANDANDNSRHVYRTFPTKQMECYQLTCDVRINTLDVGGTHPKTTSWNESAQTLKKCC